MLFFGVNQNILNDRTVSHHRITETATALPPAVSEEGADVEGEKGQPDGRTGHQVMKAKLARISSYKIVKKMKLRRYGIFLY
jgi:hypothetical protein